MVLLVCCFCFCYHQAFAMSGALAWQVNKSLIKLAFFCVAGGELFWGFYFHFYLPRLSPLRVCVAFSPFPSFSSFSLLCFLLFSSIIRVFNWLRKQLWFKTGYPVGTLYNTWLATRIRYMILNTYFSDFLLHRFKIIPLTTKILHSTVHMIYLML